MNIRTRTCFVMCALWLALPAAAQSSQASDPVDRGRYLAQISGCNDCHTPGYMEGNGHVPEANWLTGTAVGFQGPWGTTYPVNLRLYVAALSEDQWVHRLRQPMRPPMPWFNRAAMSDEDLRALYRYLKHLGPAGEPAPAAAAPGVAVTTPYFDFVPKNLPSVAKR